MNAPVFPRACTSITCRVAAPPLDDGSACTTSTTGDTLRAALPDMCARRMRADPRLSIACKALMLRDGLLKALDSFG